MAFKLKNTVWFSFTTAQKVGGYIKHIFELANAQKKNTADRNTCLNTQNRKTHTNTHAHTHTVDFEAADTDTPAERSVEKVTQK